MFELGLGGLEILFRGFDIRLCPAQLGGDLADLGFTFLLHLADLCDESFVTRLLLLADGLRQTAGARQLLLRQAKLLRGHVELALRDRKSTRLNSSHLVISYAVFCLKK